MNERDIERLAARLGEREAARVDPARTADAVVTRLRAEHVAPRPLWRRPAVRRIAAAAALIVAAGLFVLRDRSPSEAPSTASLAAAVSGLETLAAPELSEVLDSLAWGGPVTALATTAFDDLTVTQLEELLERLEG